MDPLLRWVLEALAPLRYALKSPFHFRLLLRDLGWDVAVSERLLADDGPLGDVLVDLRAVLDEAEALRATVDSLADDEEAPAATVVQALELSRAMVDLVRSLEGAASSVGALGDEVAALFVDAAFWRELAAELPGYLFVRALRRRSPFLHALLAALGVVERESVQRTGGAEVIVERLAWAHLPQLFTEPHRALADVYGWGVRLDHARLEDAIIDLAYAAGRPVEVHAPAARFYGDGELPFFVDEEAASAVRQIVAPLAAGRVLGAGFAELGLELLAVPEGGHAPTGVYLGAYAFGDVTGDLQLSPTWRLRLATGAGATLGGVRLDPSYAAPRFVDAAGATELAVSLVGEPPLPWLLLQLGTGPSLKAARLAVDLHAAEGELTLEAGVDLALGIAPGGGDAFVREAYGTTPLSVVVSPRLGWSSARGIYLAGGAGLELRVPLDLRLGGVWVDSAELAISADDGGLALSAGVTGGVDLGAVAVSLERVGLAASLSPSDDEGSGGLTAALSFLPPRGAGLAIDAVVASGGGYLSFDADKGEYAGVVDLQLLAVGLTALGLLSTRLPDGSDGWSLLLSINARIAPVPLGFGFTLNGVGGLIGVARTVDVEAFQARLAEGALDAVLFPDDPVADAPVLLRTLDELFPAAPGQLTFAPMVKIGWGVPSLIAADLGVIISLPDPITVVLVGQIASVLPDAELALLELHLDVMGTADLAAGTLALDAALYDSWLVGLSLSGGMAMRATLFGEPSFVLALGGFHPEFDPPAGFPSLKRLSVGLDFGEDLALVCETYLALTSNTVQLGARARLTAKAMGFSAEGSIGFDVLIQLAPFGFIATADASVSIRAAGVDLLGVYLTLRLTGPKPWHAVGTATFEVLGAPVDFRVEARLGGNAPDARTDAVDVGAELAAALGAPDAWSEVASAGAVVLTDDDEDGWVSPDAALEVRQGVAPLGLVIERFGAHVPTEQKSFTIADVEVDGASWGAVTEVEDWFAPATFQRMSDDEKLAAPSFERFPCGVRVEPGPAVAGDATETTFDYEVCVLDPERALLDRGRSPALAADLVRALPTSTRVESLGFALERTRYAVVDADSGAPVEVFASAAAAREARGERRDRVIVESTAGVGAERRPARARRERRVVEGVS